MSELDIKSELAFQGGFSGTESHPEEGQEIYLNLNTFSNFCLPKILDFIEVGYLQVKMSLFYTFTVVLLQLLSAL